MDKNNIGADRAEKSAMTLSNIRNYMQRLAAFSSPEEYRAFVNRHFNAPPDKGFVVDIEVMDNAGVKHNLPPVPVTVKTRASCAGGLSRTEKKKIRQLVHTEYPQFFTQKWKNIYMCIRDVTPKDSIKTMEHTAQTAEVK